MPQRLARHVAHAALLMLAMTPALGGCATGERTAWVELHGQRFEVEIADDDTERARGLMFRDAMEAGRGMLFVHDREEPQAYWMKNTRIALDILYFDGHRKLVSMQQRVPACSAGDRCLSYPSEGAALYVLELNAGTAATLGVQRGDVLTFGPGIGSERP